MINDFLNRFISTVIIVPLSLFFIIKGGYLFIFFLGFCMFFSLIEWNNMAKKKFIKIVGIFFIFFSFFSTYQIRSGTSYDHNIIDFLIVLFTCIFTDMGGYIFGNIFKGPKLTKISPNKTFAGAIGGFFSSIAFTFLILSYVSFFNKFNLIFDLKFISYILFISLVSQIGDLIVSYFKRLSKIKDTGKLIPGHGGILDRIDGMIFAFPATYLLNL